MRYLKEAIGKPGVWFLVFLGLWVAVNLYTLMGFPPQISSFDEAMNASLAMGIWKYGAIKTDIFPDSYLGQYGYGVISAWLYFGILAVFLKVFGISLFWARMVSLLSGATGLILVYLAGRELKDSWTGFLASVFLGTEALVMDVSHTGRTDAMMITIVALSLLFFIMGMKRQNNWFTGTAGFISVLSIWVRPLCLFVVPAYALALLAMLRWRSFLWFLLGCAVGCALLFFTNYLPNIGYPLLGDLDVANQYSPALLLIRGRFSDLWTNLCSNILGVFSFFKTVSVRYTIFKLSVILGFLSILINRRDAKPFYALVITATLGAFLIWPRMNCLYFPSIMPFFVLGGVLGLGRWRLARMLLLALLMVLGSWYPFVLNHRYRDGEEYFAKVLDRISSRVPAGSVVLGDGSWLWWNLERKGSRLVIPVSEDFHKGKENLMGFCSKYGVDYIYLTYSSDTCVLFYIALTPYSYSRRLLSEEEKGFINGLEVVDVIHLKKGFGGMRFDSLVLYRVNK